MVRSISKILYETSLCLSLASYNIWHAGPSSPLGMQALLAQSCQHSIHFMPCIWHSLSVPHHHCWAWAQRRPVWRPHPWEQERPHPRPAQQPHPAVLWQRPGAALGLQQTLWARPAAQSLHAETCPAGRPSRESRLQPRLGRSLHVAVTRTGAGLHNQQELEVSMPLQGLALVRGAHS